MKNELLILYILYTHYIDKLSRFQIKLHLPHVTTYATFSHLDEDELTNQQQLKMKQ